MREPRGAREERLLALVRFAGQLAAVERREAGFALTAVRHDADQEDGPAHHRRFDSGAQLAHLFVWTEDEAVLLEHSPDPDCFTILRDGWDAFMKCVASDTPPPLTDGDTVIRTDEAWIAAARQYIALSEQADELGDKLVEAKKRLLALARHTSERGAGVAVSTYWKTGTVDYKKLVQTLQIDVEPYRGPARQETRISFVKA